jgi:hypothetical protein
MHLVRNSFDHAIESSEERIAAGKSPDGNVRIDALQRGNHVVIQVTDDGRGMDPAEIRAKSEALGLIDPDTILTDKECLALVFAAGFSTRNEVSGTSGRGVGMDVVLTNLTQLGGTIDSVDDFLLHGGSSLFSGSGSLSVSSDGAEHVLLFFASVEDSTPVIKQPAVGDEDGINESPDTESTHGDGLDDSEDDVSEVESVETDTSVADGESGGNVEGLGLEETITVQGFVSITDGGLGFVVGVSSGL